MTAIVLPDLNRKTVDELRQRFSTLSDLDLSQFEVPGLERVESTATQAIDRLLGRSRIPIWPPIAVGIGLVALSGAITAWFGYVRRSGWLGMTKGSPVGLGADRTANAETNGMTSYLMSNRGLAGDDLVTSLRSMRAQDPVEEA